MSPSNEPEFLNWLEREHNEILESWGDEEE